MNRRDERIFRTTTLFEKDNIQLGLINSGRKKLKNKDNNIFLKIEFTLGTIVVCTRIDYIYFYQCLNFVTYGRVWRPMLYWFVYVFNVYNKCVSVRYRETLLLDNVQFICRRTNIIYLNTYTKITFSIMIFK